MGLKGKRTEYLCTPTLINPEFFCSGNKNRGSSGSLVDYKEPVFKIMAGGDHCAAVTGLIIRFYSFINI